MPDENELLKRLKSIQDDVNDMQGDLRVLSTLNKELNRDELLNLIQESFGKSKNKKLTWYYADGTRTIGEIAEAAQIPDGSVMWAVRELQKSGWLVKHERDGNAIYKKSEVSTGLGLESVFAQEYDL